MEIDRGLYFAGTARKAWMDQGGFGDNSVILQSFVLTVSQDLRAGLPDVWSGSHSRKAQCGKDKSA